MKKIFRSPSLQFLSRLLYALHGSCCDLFEDEVFSERFKLLEDRVYELYNIPEDLTFIDEQSVVVIGTEAESSAYFDELFKIKGTHDYSMDEILKIIESKDLNQGTCPE